MVSNACLTSSRTVPKSLEVAEMNTRVVLSAGTTLARRMVSNVRPQRFYSLWYQVEKLFRPVLGTPGARVASTNDLELFHTEKENPSFRVFITRKRTNSLKPRGAFLGTQSEWRSDSFLTTGDSRRQNRFDHSPARMPRPDLIELIESAGIRIIHERSGDFVVAPKK